MISIQIGKQKRHPLQRVLRGLLWFGILAGLAIVVIGFLFNRITRFAPPTGAIPPHGLAIEGRRTQFGPSSLTWHTPGRGSPRAALWTLTLKGDPYEIGYAHGALGNRLITAADDHMFDMMGRYVPSSFKRWLLLATVRWRYRGLAAHTPPELRTELAGMAAALYDRHRDVLPTYQRLLYYHATHDITQGLEKSPLLGCTAFAAFGPATAGGHLIIGRNFDFEGGDIFDQQKAVLLVHPTGKIPFASVAWVGFAGVVTGINAEGITIVINAARTDDKAYEGVPVSFLAREVLEQAHTLEEAISILRKQKTLVSDVFLVGDGKAQTAAVVEKSPTRFTVRRGKDTLAATNHFLGQDFAKDGENDRLRRYLTSGYRHKRLAELLHGQRGLDVRRAQELLRDRKGAGGTELGLGNRNAIDALIATHSVVIDATAMTLYVSEAPHTLGRYRAFDLKRLLRGEGEGEAATVADLPEDPLLDQDGYAELNRARELMDHARALETAGQRSRAIDAATQAVSLVPRLPDAQKLLGDLWRRAGQPARARICYEQFLALEPPYLSEVEEVKALLAAP
ncbi:MAG TPA: C45 family peptidase [Polyangia bacterium]|jgi:tetratricopeptide (TPR) repeat protein